MPFRARSALAAALMLALAGCVGTGGSSPSSTASSPAAFSLSEDAAGPITGETAYSSDTLAGLLPRFRFDTVQTFAGGKVRYLLAGFDGDGFQAFQVEAGTGRRTISSVHVVGPAVTGPNGQVIGMTYAEAGARRLGCEAGSGAWLGMAVCARSGSRITYIFAPDDYSSEPGRMPRGEALDNARLVRMIWEA
jgi:hypothetical protein